MASLATLLQPQLPFLEIIYAYLWPEISDFASTCTAARAAAIVCAERSLAEALGSSAATVLEAPWLTIQRYFASHQFAAVVGGNDGPQSLRVFRCPPGRDARWQSWLAPPVELDGLSGRSGPWRGWHQEHVVAWCCGCIFVLPDSDGEGQPMLRFNPLTEAWVNCGRPRNAPGCSLTACGGLLVATGGYGDRRAHEYDPVTGEWTPLAHMPFMRYLHGSIEL